MLSYVCLWFYRVQLRYSLSVWYKGVPHIKLVLWYHMVVSDESVRLHWSCRSRRLLSASCRMNSMVADASCRSSASYLFINMLLCFCTYISNQWLNQQSNSARDPLSSKHCIISISQLLRHFDQLIINNYVKLIREGVVLGREPLIELETQSVHINIIMEQLNHQPDHCIRDHVVLSMNMTYQHHYHIHFYGHPIAPYVNQNGNKFHSDDLFSQELFSFSKWWRLASCKAFFLNMDGMGGPIQTFLERWWMGWGSRVCHNGGLLMSLGFSTHNIYMLLLRTGKFIWVPSDE